MKKKRFHLSPIATKLLIIGLTLVLGYLIYILVSLILAKNVSSDALVHTFSPQLEHVIMSLTLIVAGSLILDVTAKELKKE